MDYKMFAVLLQRSERSTGDPGDDGAGNLVF